MFILVLITIIIIIYVIEQISIKNALKGIEYTQKPSLTIVEPNEEFDIVIILQNKTRRFVAFLRLIEKFSKEIDLHLKDIVKTGINNIESSHYLMPRQKLERRIRASIPKRGRYFLYGATIFEGDFLGVKETSSDYSCIEEVVVIPKETSLSDFEIMLSGYIGDISINRFIFEDPILTAGFNDYTGQEPQKMISWVQTARVGHLMVKKYDYTLELMVTILLNIDYNGDNHDELVEECFSIGRSVCQFLEIKNIKYRFITNATIAGSRPIWANSDYSWGKNYLMNILEGLGRAVYIVKEPYEKMMDRAMNFAELGTGHILITPNMEESYFAGKDKIRELTGQDVYVLTPNQGGE